MHGRSGTHRKLQKLTTLSKVHPLLQNPRPDPDTIELRNRSRNPREIHIDEARDAYKFRAGGTYTLDAMLMHTDETRDAYKFRAGGRGRAGGGRAGHTQEMRNLNAH